MAGATSVSASNGSGTSGSLPNTPNVFPPLIIFVNPNSGPVAGGNTVTIIGLGFLNVTAVTFGSTPATSFTVAFFDKAINAVVPPGPSGGGTVSVRVTGPGGISNPLPYTYNQAAPVVSTINPTGGPVAGGNIVAITGSGFMNVIAVTFGSTPATSFTVVSSTVINAVVPPGPSGGGTISVRVTGPSGISNALPYTYNQVAPVVSTINPTGGPVAGGNIVVITGSGFMNVIAVTFGSTPATSFTVVSSTVVNAVVPPGPSGGGTVSVYVTGSDGTSTPGLGSEYAYTTEPVTIGVSPTLGTTAGGDTITITGSGFTGTTSVDFGNTPATSFMVVSDTEIQAITPAHSTGTVLINITSPGGTNSSLSFSFVMPPVLTSITPTSGPTTGGTVVSITGLKLASSLNVNFGNIAVVPTSISDDNMVTAISPALPAGVIALTVTTAAGTSNGLAFIYVM
ncbi:uncharacterized protein PFLUO_LOCUS4577 [Penicillium psychrofluorescens]|uniref:uncharacterized protein n=1 Tax=Penicillium psychrofluorescens TaxID=3158075 RepID=UPI003CCCD861